MKLNATVEMQPVTWPETCNMHPFAPANQTAGYKEMIDSLNRDLAEITGFAAVSAQPNSGAQVKSNIFILPNFSIRLHVHILYCSCCNSSPRSSSSFSSIQFSTTPYYSIPFNPVQVESASLYTNHYCYLQGEYAGLLCIKAYHASRGDSHRNVCLIPVSAHGTCYFLPKPLIFFLSPHLPLSPSLLFISLFFSLSLPLFQSCLLLILCRYLWFWELKI